MTSICVTSVSKEPNLKSQEAQDAFGCAEPMDIVELIFKAGEIPQIAIECMKLAGYMGGVETVKTNPDRRRYAAYPLLFAERL